MQHIKTQLPLGTAFRPQHHPLLENRVPHCQLDALRLPLHPSRFQLSLLRRQLEWDFASSRGYPQVQESISVAQDCALVLRAQAMKRAI
jgi:hypothetical protein